MPILPLTWPDLMVYLFIFRLDVVGFVKALQEAEMSSGEGNDYEDMALD